MWDFVFVTPVSGFRGNKKSHQLNDDFSIELSWYKKLSKTFVFAWRLSTNFYTKIGIYQISPYLRVFIYAFINDSINTGIDTTTKVLPNGLFLITNLFNGNVFMSKTLLSYEERHPKKCCFKQRFGRNAKENPASFCNTFICASLLHKCLPFIRYVSHAPYFIGEISESSRN